MEVSAAKRLARQATELADAVPARVAPVAAKAVAAAREAGDREAAALAEQAWGHSLLHGGEVTAAIGHLRASIRHAGAAGVTALACASQIKLAYALLQRGQAAAGLREIDAAVRGLDGLDRSRARAQRGIMRYLAGRYDDALADLDVALRELRAADDLSHVQRALVNRGIVHSELHRFPEAEADLREAEELAHRLGRQLSIGMIAHNRGYLEVLRGDVPAALAALDQAERYLAAHGGQPALVHRDRAEVLLSVGLVREARQAAEEAMRGVVRQGRGLLVPMIRAQLAHAAYLDGDWASAVRSGRVAAREFTRQDRPEWAAHAKLVVLRAQLAAGDRPRAGDVDAMVDTLHRAGWRAATVESRLVAARLAKGETRELHLRRAGAARRRGPAALRARGWYAEALRRHDRGDDRGCLAAIREGLDVLDEHRAALGAADLRAHSARHRHELADLGLRLAMTGGAPTAVFEWAGRAKASRLRHRAARPPHDPELAALLSRLRATAVGIDRAREAGTPVARLVTRQVELEERIRDHVRQRPGDGASATRPVDPDEVAKALGDSALVEYIDLDGVLHAVTIADGTVRLHALGPGADVANLIDRMAFALHRLANPRTRPDSRSAADVLLHAAAARLDDLVLRPAPELADRPVVVVPTGALYGVPWSVLPSRRDSAVSVTPSATLWHGIGDDPPGKPATVAVAAGPHLPGAVAEARDVASIHGATPLLGPDATVEAVLSAIDGADLAHLAAHGRLSADNPLFSRLQFHDGPLVAHDVEQLGGAPRTVVLAACDTGRSVVYTGDELLSLATTFIGCGTAHLVASLVPIPDAETAPLMTVLHGLLADGRPPATALAAAVAEVADAGPAERAAAAGFICFGR